MVTVWWSAASLIYYSFLNLSKTITSKKYAQFTDETHQKLKCLVLVNRKDPILLHDNAWLHVAQRRLQRLDELGYEVLPHLPYSPDLLPTDYHFFKNLDNFLQGKCFHNQQEAENGFQEFVESQNMDFYIVRINFFLVGKNMLIAMFPILINKDNFEPSYNDLKFTVQNCNYVCTNLVYNISHFVPQDFYFPIATTVKYVEGFWYIQTNYPSQRIQNFSVT